MHGALWRGNRSVDCGIETIPIQGGVETNSIQTVGWRLFQYKEEEEEGFGSGDKFNTRSRRAYYHRRSRMTTTQGGIGTGRSEVRVDVA